jgi:hypothetical protein
MQTDGGGGGGGGGDEQQVLQELKRQGLLVAAPPTDDDDAYALTIALRENARARQRDNNHGPAFVLSNDLFRDAQLRDASLEAWLKVGGGDGGGGLLQGGGSCVGPGRISYAFCDMGRLDDYGERELDIIPNPRHPLIVWIEQQLRQPQPQQHSTS